MVTVPIPSDLSQRIVEKVSAGMKFPAAFEAVLGTGSFRSSWLQAVNALPSAPDMTGDQKNVAISLRILSRMADGLELPDAMDSVLGIGTYRQIAESLYDSLWAKGNA